MILKEKILEKLNILANYFVSYAIDSGNVIAQHPDISQSNFITFDNKIIVTNDSKIIISKT